MFCRIGVAWNNKFWYTVKAFWTLKAHRGPFSFSKSPSSTVLRFSAPLGAMFASRTQERIAYILTLGAEETMITLALRRNQPPVITVVAWSAICTIFSLS